MTEPTNDTTPAAPIDPQTTQLDTSKHVNPSEGADKESTPIGDEVAKSLANDEDDDDEEELTEVPFAAKSYKVDVERALARTTQDGKGDDEVPPSDWQGYATNDVEVQD